MRDAVSRPPEWLELALDWLYPRKCGLCEALGPPTICEDCRSEFPPIQFRLGVSQGPLDWSLGLYPYQGRPAQAVRLLKYQRATSLGAPLAEELASHRHRLPHHDLIVPVPIHASRKRERGFNQADLLVEAMPEAMARPDCIVRIRKTRPQVELTASERLANLRDAFRADSSVLGRSVALVDDVLTTGGTAVACASALKIAGATSVGVYTFCIGH